MNKLLKNSLVNFLHTVQNNGKFQYHLLNKGNEFLSAHRKSVLEKVREVEQSLAFAKSDEVAKFENYLSPTEGNIMKIMNGIARSSESEIPVPGSTKQEKANYVMEQFLYTKLKPLRLLANIQQFSHIKSTSNSTFKIMDIDNPMEWFPEARKMKRKIIMHVGPTNSGKTYNALQKLENSNTGYYAGPLRLLAREVYDKFQAKGIRCNLLTGEEVVPDIDQFGNISGLTSGTVEMISMMQKFDVVVLDEIQMISDPRRGSAWTNVVLGCQAKELHLCGEASAVPLIKQIIAMTGDEMEIHEYKRLGDLKVEEFPITQLSDFQKGDCIISFSKKKILGIKAFLENKTNFKCGVIYGALPPETRTTEANKFNNGEYDILVASDAVGMGLNLSIRRIVFTELSKFDGGGIVDLSNSNIKQIGGRAGRYGLKNDAVGRINAIDSHRLTTVKKGMRAPVEYLPQAALWIPSNLWIRYFSLFPAKTKLVQIYKRFETDLEELKRKHEKSKKKSMFFIGEVDERKQIANFFDTFKLLDGFLIPDQLVLINAPFQLYFDKSSGSSTTEFDTKSDYITREFVNIMKSRTSKSAIHIADLLDLYNTDKTQYRRDNAISSGNDYALQLLNLRRLEVLHKLVTLYIWLSYRFPKSFIDYESVSLLKSKTEAKISSELEQLRNDRLRRNEFMF